MGFGRAWEPGRSRKCNGCVISRSRNDRDDLESGSVCVTRRTGCGCVE